MVPRVVPLVSLGSPEGAIVWPPPTPVRQRAKEKKSASGAPGAEAAESENSEDAESPEELPVGIQDQVLARAEALQQLEDEIPERKRRQASRRQQPGTSSSSNVAPDAVAAATGDVMEIQAQAEEMAVAIPAVQAAGEIGPEAAQQDVPAPKARADLRREAHAAGVRLSECGTIFFHLSKDGFEARCQIHKGCVMTRTCKGRARQAAAGRPLGLLAAWLLSSHEAASKAEHVNKEWGRAKFTHEARCLAREALLKEAGGPALAAFERPRLPGEEEEPPTLDGLL